MLIKITWKRNCQKRIW